MALEKQFLKTKPEAWVTFTVPQTAVENAVNCYLVGEFNDWQPKKMTKSKDGQFRQRIKLSVEQSYLFRYQFEQADGQVVFENDWQADAYRGNGLGEENSVVVL